MRVVTALLFLALTGCAHSPRPTREETEARAYQRGYGQAVKEQYWIIQRQQREPQKPQDP
jgi:hypothetical protein